MQAQNLEAMKRLLIFLLLLLPFVAEAQSRLYKGNSTYSSDILYTYDGKHLYAGSSTYSGDTLFTCDGKYLYVGCSTYTTHTLCTITRKHIYRGRSSYSGDILYTMSGYIPLPLLVLVM